MSKDNRSDQFAISFSRRLFTWQSLLAHVAVFAVAWRIEGGDHHLFLDAISVEAVLVTLLVGMATRRAELQRSVLEQIDRERLQADLDTDRATNQLLRLQGHEVQKLSMLSEEIHSLSEQIHSHLSFEERKR